jgi:DNA-binding transcriptional regulator/RsmH inhibitor MraZ
MRRAHSISSHLSLERYLNPQWEDRDEARARYESRHGPGSWMANKFPRGHYAAMRRDAEERLRIAESLLKEVQLAKEKICDTMRPLGGERQQGNASTSY